MVSIRACEIDSKRNIGTLKGKPVFEINTKGGFSLICSPQASGIEYMASGSHKALARHAAKKKYGKDLKITELQKSEEISVVGYEHQLAYWQSVTDQLNAASKK